MTDGISNMHEQAKLEEAAKNAQAMVKKKGELAEEMKEKKAEKKKRSKKTVEKNGIPKHRNVYSALAAAQCDLKEIDADGVNDHFGNRYTTLGSLLGGVRPVLAKHGLAITMTTNPHWEETVTRVKSEDAGVPETVRTREMVGHEIHCSITHGESSLDERIVSTLFIPRGGNIQQFGSSLTYCRRYLVQSIVSVHTDKDDDGNDAVGKPTKAQPRGTNQVREHLQGKN